MFCGKVRFIHNRAVLEKHNPVGVGGDARVVRHHHHRAAGPQLGRFTCGDTARLTFPLITLRNSLPKVFAG